jgi:outer membrane murein-binding lipoprotein Lpp
LEGWFCNDYQNSVPARRLSASRCFASRHIETDFTGLAREEFRMKNLMIGMLALSGLLVAGCSYQTQIDQATSQAESSAQQASTASSNAQNSANTAAQSAKTAQEAAAGAEDSVKRANDAVARLEAAFASSVTK